MMKYEETFNDRHKALNTSCSKVKQKDQDGTVSLTGLSDKLAFRFRRRSAK